MIHIINDFLDMCDLEQLNKPDNAVEWSCKKPINDGKVPKGTKCEIICQDGYEAKHGKNSNFRRPLIF